MTTIQATIRLKEKDRNGDEMVQLLQGLLVRISVSRVRAKLCPVLAYGGALRRTTVSYAIHDADFGNGVPRRKCRQSPKRMTLHSG